jgi:4-hydroxybenzoate polyprenyltransferase
MTTVTRCAAPDIVRAGFLARAEASFWLTRPHVAFSKVPMAAAGWAIGRADLETSTAQAAALVLLICSMQMLMFVANDLNDAQKDRITAPYLPLASGLLTRADGIAEAIALAVVFVGGGLFLAPSRLTFLVVLASVPATFGILAFYSRTKAAWYSSLLGSTASASFAVWGWLLAGHRQPGAFALLYVIASLHGVHNNLRSQIYDIEGDPKAGTLTLAARLGPTRALLTAAALRVVEIAAIAMLAARYGTPGGALWLVPTIGVLAVVIAGLPKASATTRNRQQQTDALFTWVYLSFLTELSVIGALRPVLALGLGAFMTVWFHAVRAGYYGRLVGNQIAPLPDAGIRASGTA